MGKSIDKEKLYSNLENCYAELAYTDLAMVYYSFCEKDSAAGEFGRDRAVRAQEFRKALEKLIGGCFADADSVTGMREEAYKLRAEIKETVNRMVDKRERIALDEYVNARKGDASVKFNYEDDDDAARRILQAIFAYDDNPTINENIKTAVYELPVRMTKGRFFDILEDGLKKYIGGPCDAIERAVYMIESAAGIRGEQVTGLDGVDPASLDAEIEYINDIAELCNYVCVLTECTAGQLEKSKNKADFLRAIVEAAADTDSAGADEKFIRIEGELERLSEDQVVLEGRFDSVIEEFRDSLTEREEKLERMKRLMSASVYADLENGDETEITAEKAEAEFKKLSEKLSGCFAEGDKALNRARMAAVLSSLPVFFNSRTDCMNYVREALSGCRDNYEKNVAVGNILSGM